MRRLAALFACLALTACSPQEPLAPLPATRIYLRSHDALTAALQAGYTPIEILGTGSMGQTLGGRRGADLVTAIGGIDKTTFAELKLGYLVARKDEGTAVLTVHRIIARRGDAYVMKGSANKHPDATLLTAENYRGRIAWIGVVE